jgi:hypothetical protein
MVVSTDVSFFLFFFCFGVCFVCRVSGFRCELVVLIHECFCFFLFQ